MLVPVDAVPSAFVGLGATLSSEGATPFPGCSEPSLLNPGALSLASQGTGSRLSPDCVAAIPCGFLERLSPSRHQLDW
jgi:hypothetical protein